jgi:hypothetical protein
MATYEWEIESSTASRIEQRKDIPSETPITASRVVIVSLKR